MLRGTQLIGFGNSGKKISFVGWAAEASPTADVEITVSLTSLTGGIDTAARAGDVVVFVHAARTSADPDVNMGAVTSGYTELADIYANDFYEMNLSASWKRMNSTPDTSVVSTSPYGRSAGIVYVLRNVNSITPIDVTTTTSVTINTGIAVPPAITPVTYNSLVISAVANMSGSTNELTEPTNYTNVAKVVTSGLSPYAHIGVSSILWSGGTVTPPSWTGISDNADYASAAITMAFRP